MLILIIPEFKEEMRKLVTDYKLIDEVQFAGSKTFQAFCKIEFGWPPGFSIADRRDAVVSKGLRIENRPLRNPFPIYVFGPTAATASSSNRTNCRWTRKRCRFDV